MFAAQSAMEYLMTYGWAILIIAVVLGALFGLGFFNSANLAPKVSAGACQVYRPHGPGTTSFINLEGTCNNELPQYVAQFNGASSNILLNSAITAGTTMTYSAWINPISYGSTPTLPIMGTGGLVNYVLYYNNDYLYVGGNGVQINWVVGVLNNKWDLITVTNTGTTVTLYLNGISLGPQTLSTPITTVASLGFGQANYFDGSISNVQLYNTSLSANEVTALYDEGIGGVPLNLNNLVGWWPLNGNANDYSGNLNNGVPTNVVFTSSWTNSYTAP